MSDPGDSGPRAGSARPPEREPAEGIAANGLPRESVWDYPRPPRVEPCRPRVRVEARGEPIAESDRALRVLETSGPPTIYVPWDDIGKGRLRPAAGTTVCEWKGTATYLDVRVAPKQWIERAAWTYRQPTRPYRELRDHYSFYPALVECYLDDERVSSQPGDYYGGWITAEIAGPFKGAPGTGSW